MIEILASAAATILRHARITLPEECCGALLGGPDKGTHAQRITDAVPLENISADDRKTRYTVDPRGILRADMDARQRGLDVVGFYHSHPQGEGRPSREDARQAWEGYVYVIVEFHAGDAAKLRAWQFKENSFEEITLQIRQ